MRWLKLCHNKKLIETNRHKGDKMKKDKNYFKILIKDLWIASRPLSLTLAIASTTLGILVAYNEGILFQNNSKLDWFKIILITIAGIGAQLGANFINDYFEGSFRYHRPAGRKVKFLGVDRTYFDILVFMCGMISFAVAAVIGLILIYLTNIQMFWIGIIGIIGSYAYTGEPFVYKRRGLGVPLSFILMGPLMVYGAYFPFGMSFSWAPILVALPPSFFIPALMISNEMRDFTRDRGLSLGTLSVRIGSEKSRRLYATLVFGAYILTGFYILLGIYPIYTIAVFLTLPLAFKAYRCVASFKGLGIPYTNNLHWLFNLIIILSLWISGLIF